MRKNNSGFALIQTVVVGVLVSGLILVFGAANRWWSKSLKDARTISDTISIRNFLNSQIHCDNTFASLPNGCSSLRQIDTKSEGNGIVTSTNTPIGNFNITGKCIGHDIYFESRGKDIFGGIPLVCPRPIPTECNVLSSASPPVYISTPAQFMAMSDNTHYQLTKDIEFTVPEVPSYNSLTNTVINGRGFKIKNLKMASIGPATTSNFIIAPYFTADRVLVKDLTIEGLELSFDGMANSIKMAGLFASAHASCIVRSSVKGIVNAKGVMSRLEIGGMVGQMWKNQGDIQSRILDSTSNVSIQIEFTGQHPSLNDEVRVGGFTASTQAGIIENSSSLGGINILSGPSVTNLEVKAGGISGWLVYSFIETPFVPSVSRRNWSHGAITVNLPSVDNSASGGGTVVAGGLIGMFTASTIERSYSTAPVSVTTAGLYPADWAGGLVGLAASDGMIIDSYATGAVSSTTYAAGLVGSISGTGAGTVQRCYSTGAVTRAINRAGLVSTPSIGIVADSFWDEDTSGIATGAYGLPKTTAEMKQVTTYPASWTSSQAWELTPGEYPRLK